MVVTNLGVLRVVMRREGGRQDFIGVWGEY